MCYRNESAYTAPRRNTNPIYSCFCIKEIRYVVNIERGNELINEAVILISVAVHLSTDEYQYISSNRTPHSDLNTIDLDR